MSARNEENGYDTYEYDSGSNSSIEKTLIDQLVNLAHSHYQVPSVIDWGSFNWETYGFFS